MHNVKTIQKSWNFIQFALHTFTQSHAKPCVFRLLPVCYIKDNASTFVYVRLYPYIYGVKCILLLKTIFR